MVIKQRNLHLEAQRVENQAKIKELMTSKKDAEDIFASYQKQTKEEKEAADAHQIKLEN